MRRLVLAPRNVACSPYHHLCGPVLQGRALSPLMAPLYLPQGLVRVYLASCLTHLDGTAPCFLSGGVFSDQACKLFLLIA